jgi:hypothetical protein
MFLTTTKKSIKDITYNYHASKSLKLGVMVHWYNPSKELGTKTSLRFESNGVQVKLFLALY